MGGTRTGTRYSAWLALIVIGSLGARPVFGVAQLTGTVSYTGAAGPVSNSKPIRLELHADAFFADSRVDKTRVSANGGGFALSAPNPGNYFFAYYLDLINNGRPSVGDPYQ